MAKKPGKKEDLVIDSKQKSAERKRKSIQKSQLKKSMKNILNKSKAK